MKTNKSTAKDIVPRILDDKSANKDEFVESTHEDLAEKICALIANTSGAGYTIGLEGKWGSGKSTVVEILCGKLKKNKTAFPFYIDAWEHEGDSLRRMFLGSLIHQLRQDKTIEKECGVELEQIQKKVNSKQSAVTVSQATSMSMFGKIVAALLFLVPFGTVLVENTLDEVTIGIGLPIHRRFCLGLALMLAPLLAYPIQGIRWVYSWIRKKYANKADGSDKQETMPSFAWFDAKAELQTMNTTTEETEKDSVEFATFFSEIVKSVKNKVSKLVIIVDNLDRINHHDALKIWSVLQTFIHCQREEAEPQKWILVPYSEEGMKALWKEDQGKESETTDISVGKSFLDKNFQIRFEVPDLLIGDWQAFGKTKIQELFNGFSEDEHTTILNILGWMRRNSADAPSPREIKLYLNQVRLLYDIHSKDGVSLSSICFYVTQRYLRGMSRKKLESELIAGTIASHSLPLASDNALHLAEDLCAILFHVTPEKGIQMLLEGKIKSCLVPEKAENLNNLFQTHGNAFVGVLGNILSHAPDGSAFEYALSVQEGLGTVSGLFHNMAISHWRNWFLKAPKQSATSIKYSRVIDFGAVVRSDSKLAQETWKFLAPAFRDDLIEQKASYNLWLIYLRDAKSEYGIDIQVDYTEAMLPMLKECDALDVMDKHDFAAFLQIPSGAEDQIAGRIGSAHDLEVGLPVALSILVKAGLQDVNKICAALQKAFSSPLSRSDKYFQMIACLDCLRDKSIRQEAIHLFLQMRPVWDAVVNHNSDYPKNLFAYLIAKYLATTSLGEICSLLQINQNLISSIVVRWKKSSVSNARDIYQLTRDSGDYSYLQAVAGGGDNVLLGDIVRIAIQDNDSQLGSGNNSLGMLSLLLKFIPDKERNGLALLFLEAGEIVRELEKIQNASLSALLPTLQLLVTNMSEPQIVQTRSGIERILATAAQEEWNKVFSSPATLVVLLRALKKGQSKLSLTSAFCEAFKRWLFALFEAKDQKSKLEMDDISVLFYFLDAAFTEDVAVWINQLAKRKTFVLRPVEAKIVLVFSAHDKWMDGDGEIICQTIQNAVTNKKKDELQQLVPILLAGLNSFNPSTRFSSTLKEPVDAWLKDAPEDVAQSLYELCDALNIERKL